MTFLEMLRDAQQRNRSMLCVGLDPEPARFPAADGKILRSRSRGSRSAQVASTESAYFSRA